MKLFLLDENNNKVEVTTEVLTALVEQIKCCVSGTPFKMAFVSQAKYNELEAAGLVQANTIYEITDDTTADDLDGQLVENKQTLAQHTNQLNELASFLDNKTTIKEVTKITQSGLYSIDVVIAGTSEVAHSTTFYVTKGVTMAQTLTLLYSGGQVVPAMIYCYADGDVELEYSGGISGYYALGKIRLINGNIGG